MATPNEELRLLSLFHYILAGLEGLFGLIPLVHVTIGALMVTGRIGAQPGPEPFAALGWLFIVMGGVFVLGGLTVATLTALAGRFLAQHRRHTFCMVVAGITCAFVPLGTVLGIFTILGLQKPGVRALFGLPLETRAPPGPPPL